MKKKKKDTSPCLEKTYNLFFTPTPNLITVCFVSMTAIYQIARNKHNTFSTEVKLISTLGTNNSNYMYITFVNIQYFGN